MRFLKYYLDFDHRRYIWLHIGIGIAIPVVFSILFYDPFLWIRLGLSAVPGLVVAICLIFFKRRFYANAGEIKESDKGSRANLAE